MSRKLSLYLAAFNRLATEEICKALGCEYEITEYDHNGEHSPHIGIKIVLNDTVAKMFRFVAHCEREKEGNGYRGWQLSRLIDSNTLMSQWIRTVSRKVRERIAAFTGEKLDYPQGDLWGDFDVLALCRLLREGKETEIRTALGLTEMVENQKGYGI